LTTGEASSSKTPPQMPPLWVFLILACFDCSATAVSSVGLIWVDASTNQMLRGSMVVFTAVFSVMIFRRCLPNMKWIGVGIVVAGLLLVGLSSVLQKSIDGDSGDDTQATASQVSIGIALVFLGSALNGFQNVMEEKLMKGTDCHPLLVVGWEGFFGIFLASFLLLPISSTIPGDDCGKAEDTLDTLYMLYHSWLITFLCVLYALSLYVMNYTLMEIAKVLSAVHRSLINSCRTVLVWVGDILLYYVFTGHDFGESWTRWSFMQLGGFVLLVAGTVVYGSAGTAAKSLPSAEYLQENEKHYTQTTTTTITTTAILDSSQTNKQSINSPKTSKTKNNSTLPQLFYYWQQHIISSTLFLLFFFLFCFDLVSFPSLFVYFDFQGYSFFKKIVVWLCL